MAFQIGLTVNHSSRRRLRRSVASGLLVCVVGAAVLKPLAAQAQLTGSASGTTQYVSNSNLFALDTGLGQHGTGNTPVKATDFSYGAAFEGAYAFGRQQVYAVGRATQYDYQGLSELSHFEYSVDTGLKWQLAETLDGNLDVSRTHTMVPFLDLSGAESLSVQTAQQEKFQIGLTVNSDWRFEGSGLTSKTTQPVAPVAFGSNQQPVAGTSNQELTQYSGTAAIRYTGIGPLTSGVAVGYSTGDNGGFIGTVNSSYRQYTAGLVAAYKLDRTSFDGQVGYTSRTSDDGGGNTAGLTGLIDFRDQLTPKTSFSVNIERAIQTLYLNLGSEVDSEAGVSVAWQATYKIGVSLGYTFTYRAFPEPSVGPNDAYQVDYEQRANIAVSYQPFRWLSITPYGNILTRRSNIFGQDFGANVYGITLTASVGDAGTKR
jgi:hypothetical protein